MLSNRVEYKFPLFKHISFFSSEAFICHIELSTNFKFYFIINLLYSDWSLKLMKKFNKFFLKSFSIHWFRVSFKGKGYRLRKFKESKKITFNFGHSHWTKILISGEYFFKKLKRQNYICLTKYYILTKFFKKYIKRIKKLNSYTKRGLRLKKQFIQKRFGKISQVVSSLH